MVKANIPVARPPSDERDRSSIPEVFPYHPGQGFRLLRPSLLGLFRARLVEIADKLSEMFSAADAPQPAAILELDSSFLEAARTLLGTLAERPTRAYYGAVELTAQQIETHLEFSPDFLDAAKAMLRDFIERTEASRASGDGQSSRS